MNLKLYNALTRKKELFKPIHKTWVGLYTCGPTVYNYAHIGNLRTYIFEDILHRVLQYAGYNVRHIMNITDVDDKIIRDAAKAKQTIFEFVKPYEQAFFEDIQALSLISASKYTKATDHIPDMVKLIDVLIKKGIAYQMDGSVYFSIKNFKPYGRLSRVLMHEFKTGARGNADEYSKKDIQDFALWKGKKEGEPSWQTPFGEGHPGWHIECSAMSMKYLGSPFDIHAGGIDLMFPHHENEIAQSESATGKQFVRFFIEGEHLLVNGEKMSKSLGNIVTLRDFEARTINPIAFRYLVLTSHYRSKLNFTWASLEAAQHSLERLYDTVRLLKIKKNASNKKEKKYQTIIIDAQKKIETTIADDLNTPKALAIMWNMIRAYHKKPEYHDVKKVLAQLYDFDRIFGLGFAHLRSDVIPQTIVDLANEREKWRKAKDWKKADQARKKITQAGFEIEDTPEGPRVNVKKI